MSSYFKSLRVALIVLALFPTLWGLLGVLNNISGFEGTAQYAVSPMISMSDTYGNPAQTWRAITSPMAATLGLIFITTLEGLAGLFGILAIFKMLKNLNQPSDSFQEAKIWLVYSALLGIFVWGIGFMVIAGDWFLAWQGESGLSTQTGGLLYTLPCMITLLASIAHKE